MALDVYSAAAATVADLWGRGVPEGLSVVVVILATAVAFVSFVGATSASQPAARRAAAIWLACSAFALVSCATFGTAARWSREARLAEACSTFLEGVSKGTVREIGSDLQDRVRWGCGEGPLQAAANASSATVRLH